MNITDHDLIIAMEDLVSLLLPRAPGNRSLMVMDIWLQNSRLDLVPVIRARRKQLRKERDYFIQNAPPGGLRCGICKHPITGEWNIDHILPLARGGTNDITNLQPSHLICNLLKGPNLRSRVGIKVTEVIMGAQLDYPSWWEVRSKQLGMGVCA